MWRDLCFQSVVYVKYIRLRLAGIENDADTPCPGRCAAGRLPHTVRAAVCVRGGPVEPGNEPAVQGVSDQLLF